MPTLLTPERTVQFIADKNALDDYAKARSAAGWLVDKHLKANLAQLLEFDMVGKDRSKRWEAVDAPRGKFYNMADVSWFYRADIRVAVPLFGKPAEKHRQIKQQYNIKEGIDVFKLILDGKRSSKEGWSGGPPPAALATLPDGASIIGLGAHASEPFMLPDFGSVQLGSVGAQFESAVEQASSLEVSSGLGSRQETCQVSIGIFSKPPKHSL